MNGFLVGIIWWLISLLSAALVKGDFQLQQNTDTKGWEIILKVPPEEYDDWNSSGDEDEQMESDYFTSSQPEDPDVTTVVDSSDPNWDEEW